MELMMSLEDDCDINTVPAPPQQLVCVNCFIVAEKGFGSKALLSEDNHEYKRAHTYIQG